MKRCQFCKNIGNHYIGGCMWVCFEHFLRIFLGGRL